MKALKIERRRGAPLLSGFIPSVFQWFPIVRRKDEEKYAEYRTKRMVLEAYEGLESLTH